MDAVKAPPQSFPDPFAIPDFNAALHLVPIRILMVDDEKNFTDQMIANLRMIPGYEAICENEPRQAIETAERFDPDLILLDLRMPNLDGEAIDAELSTHADLMDTPVVYLTATAKRTGKKEIRRVGDLGERVTLSKPVRMAELIRCIDQHVLH